MRYIFTNVLRVCLLLWFIPTLNAQDCTCTEYLYLNELTNGGAVHKYSIAANGDLTEVLNGGNPWYPGALASEMSNPHGLGTDLNGFLYISETRDGNIRQLTCDGEITDAADFEIELVGSEEVFNMTSIGNTLYTSYGAAFDLCTGNLLGNACFETVAEARRTWGLWYDKKTEYFYSSLASNKVFRFTKDAYTSMDCVPLFLESGATNPPVVGDMSLPAGGTIQGITTDTAGYIYIVYGSFNQPGGIMKYDPNGGYMATSVIDANEDGSGYFENYGIVYSETCDCLYSSSLSTQEDCLAFFDTDLNYLGAAVDPVGDTGQGQIGFGQSKAVGIISECCPTTTPLNYNEIVCTTGGGEKYFLQDIFSCGDGIICGGTWSETANTSGGAIAFEPCDLSITVTGIGCAEYTLTNTDVSSSCGAFEIVVNVCSETPAATLMPNAGTCTNTSPNNDATISISAAVGDEANYSLGATYTGADYNGVGAVAISGGIGSITGLIHNTQYTVRVFNGSNDCFIDETIMTPSITCNTPCPNPNCFGVSTSINN